MHQPTQCVYVHVLDIQKNCNVHARMQNDMVMESDRNSASEPSGLIVALLAGVIGILSTSAVESPDEESTDVSNESE